MKRTGIIEKLKRDETGVTLVELLAGIAILSIVVTAFLAFFIQAANTNKQTNEMNEATFLAQEEMEFMTHYSTGNYSEEEVIGLFDDINGKYLRQFSSDGYEIKTELVEPSDESSLYKIVVEVTGGGKDRAKMETRLPFEKTTD
ncbi:hypothetical protein SAMN04488102_10682 [Alkalibacterium subtropicum]|uniref:Prepilin-type N-terminal cleavage/methylation domain-containing protein n=1 Tax=Alkalibacterium subtropicum TaxID=753702 RepID=A0A1I1IY68_9LACT|nr:prepilin-type N-terminal cleavage/methylation domain-containing protein [Alkalibacterium subtropicum]SFC41186.1 hypothetical protein SAMN04488102_10682 [Alkalibacterium subtropicum]